MKKINLDVDALSVESFATAALREDARGTVHGNDLSVQASCKGTCISCPVATDPCLCDPIHLSPGCRA